MSAQTTLSSPATQSSHPARRSAGLSRRAQGRSPGLRLGLGLGLGLGALCFASQAHADSLAVAVDGGVHVDVGAVHVNVDGALDAAVSLVGHLEAGLAFGVRFAEPPPPPEPVVVVTGCSYRCANYAAVPGYYVEQEVYVEQPQTAVYVAPLARPIERWGLGAFAGSLHIDGQEGGSDMGLVGRYRLSPVFAIEAEVAKSQMEGGGRSDRHLGASLLIDLSPRADLSPFLLAGAGFGQTDIGDGEFHAEQGYGEIGAGLDYAQTRSLHLTADVRAGARKTRQDVAYMSSTPVADFSKDEQFTRARIGGLLFF